MRQESLYFLTFLYFLYLHRINRDIGKVSCKKPKGRGKVQPMRHKTINLPSLPSWKRKRQKNRKTKTKKKKKKNWVQSCDKNFQNFFFSFIFAASYYSQKNCNSFQRCVSLHLLPFIYLFFSRRISCLFSLSLTG